MLVVTPNTCIDITTWLSTLVPGTVSRSRRTFQSAGGKGVNVCRTMRALGHPSRLIGLSPQEDRRLELMLADEGCDFVPIVHQGPGRVCLIFLEDDGRSSVVNGRGPDPGQWDLGGLLPTIADELDRASGVICSGSLPPGLSDGTYGDVVTAAHQRSRPAFVDAAPAVLAATLPSAPDLVSPNLGEAEALLHGRTEERVEEDFSDELIDRCLDAATKLHDRGAQRAVVTAGSHGAALVTDAGGWWLSAASVPVLNPIGAGDSFVAGTAAAMVDGADDVTAVRRGMAVAAAAVQHETAGVLDPALIDTALPEVVCA